MGQAAVIGLDLGTSGVKALVAAEDGAVLGRATAGYRVSAPAPGYAETDPEDWWAATRFAVQDALAEAGQVTVTGLAVAGQMHGVVLVDDRSAPLRPAILWLDQRAAAEAARYADLPCGYTAVTGNPPSAGMAGPVLAWLARHEPYTLRASWWALQPKDWLRQRLTGQAATDPTDASGTLLYDLEKDAWAEDLIKALGVPRELLAPVRASTETAGILLPAAAADLGLLAGIPVTVGAADTAAALYAASLQPGDAMLTLGSGAQWAMYLPGDRPRGDLPGERPPVPPGVGGGERDRKNRDRIAPAPADGSDLPGERPRIPSGGGPASTNLYRAVGGGCYRLAPVQNAGITLDWVRTMLGASWDELYATAARPRPQGAPVFHPYLTPERWDEGATATWSGLTLAHQREDLLRSALDGVAILLKERLDDLRRAGHAPRRVILSGGGTTHPAWRALLAETLALPVTPAPTTWLTATGATRLAARPK